MGTFMAKPAEIERKWYIIDAAGRPLGRTSREAARILRGKHKPIFTPISIPAILLLLSMLIKLF